MNKSRKLPLAIVDLPKLSRKYQHTDTHYRLDWLPENFSFLECFSYGPISILSDILMTAEITRNRFCGVFLKNHKYLGEVFLCL